MEIGEDWDEKGACKGMNPDIFFPDDNKQLEEAKIVCGQCAVREACLEYALANRIDHGVWGGESARARRRILRKRREEAA